MNEQAPPEEPAGPTIGQRLRAAPITAALTLLNVAVFVWAETHGRTTEKYVLLQTGAMEPLHVWSGEYWRLATCMFLHIGWFHLLWNSYASYGWCAPIEQLLGKRRFLLVYLLSGLAGGSASSVAALIFGGRVSAGASGAMFGIVGATLAIRRRQLGSFAAFKQDRGVRSTLATIGIWTVIGLTAFKMDNSAHFGGFCAGALATWILTAPPPRTGRWLVFAVAFGALVIGAARPWWTPSGIESARLAAFTYGWLHGSLPRDDDKREVDDEHRWALDVPRGIRLGEKGCARGVVGACWALFTYYDGKDDARARELTERVCTLEPSACTPKPAPASD